MSADEAPPRRLHPLALLSGFGKAARQMFGAVVAGGYFAFQGRVEISVLIVGALLLSTLLGLGLHWWRFTYRIGEDAVRIDSGILNRNHRTLPFDRVQDVSIAQGPIQRLAGVARVTLETGGSSLLKEEGVLAAIALPLAEELRERVRVRRAGTRVVADGGEPVERELAEDERPLFALDSRRILILGLFNFSLALFAALFGATQTLGDLVNIDPFERRFWQPILLESGWGQYLLDHRLGLALGGLAVLVVAGMLTGIVRTLLREWGFRLDRTGKALRRRRGLLTRTDVSLPRRRIQAGVIATGPVRDHFGWRAFEVQSLAGDGGESSEGAKSDHVLAPLADDREVAAIAAELGWRTPGADTGWRPVSRAHIWSFCLMLLPLFPLLLILGPLRWLAWKRTAFAREEGKLLIRTGWWRRRTMLIPLRNIQSVDLRETALSRRFGVASLVVDIAGGSPFGNVIPSLPRKEASLLRKELLALQP